MAEYEAAVAPPGKALRDPAYQDLCGFYGGFPDGQAWRPRFGDWVVALPSNEPLLVLHYEDSTEQVRVIGGSDAESRLLSRTACVWLPTLDQLRARIVELFGTTGFFFVYIQGLDLLVYRANVGNDRDEHAAAGRRDNSRGGRAQGFAYAPPVVGRMRAISRRGPSRPA